MAQVTLRIVEHDDSDLMLVGWIFAAADLRRPVVRHSVVLRPTLESRIQLAPGVYFFRFNVNVSGKFAVAAQGPAVAGRRDSFDTRDGGHFHRSFRFEVGS